MTRVYLFKARNVVLLLDHCKVDAHRKNEKYNEEEDEDNRRPEVIE